MIRDGARNKSAVKKVLKCRRLLLSVPGWLEDFKLGGASKGIDWLAT